MIRSRLGYVLILSQRFARRRRLGADKLVYSEYKVSRYKDSIAENLRRRELDLVNSDLKNKGREDGEPDWDDRDKMFVHVGGFVESSSTTTNESPTTTSPNTTTPTVNVEGRSSRSTLELPREIGGENALEEYASSASTVSPYPPSTRSSSPARPSSTTTTTTGLEKLLVPHTSYLSPSSSPGSRRTESEAIKEVERNGGIVLDAEREVMLSFLVGKTGKKHGKLPTMVRLLLFLSPFPQ